MRRSKKQPTEDYVKCHQCHARSNCKVVLGAIAAADEASYAFVHFLRHLPTDRSIGTIGLHEQDKLLMRLHHTLGNQHITSQM